MLFLKKTSKPMIIVVLLSLAVALAMDAAIQAPVSNTSIDGKVVSSELGDMQLLEAGIFDRIFSKIKSVVNFVVCVVSTPPSGWGECTVPSGDGDWWQF